MDRELILPNEYLEELVSELTDAGTIGFLLTGSHARGDATRYSDVDLIKFVNVLPDERTFSLYRDSRLVTVSITSVGTKLEEMSKPATAIWVVPAIRQARILADVDGSVGKL